MCFITHLQREIVTRVEDYEGKIKNPNQIRRKISWQ